MRDETTARHTLIDFDIIGMVAARLGEDLMTQRQK